MGQVHRLRQPGPGDVTPAPLEGSADVSSLDDARCALCGATLVGHERFHLVSPLVSMGGVTVCRGCRKAALSEGYRPSD
jgi:hypothetical protein